MRKQRTAALKDGIVVARGYAIKIRVDRSHLIIDDGVGRDRQTRRYHRTSRLRRLILIGHTGYITLDALRWLHDTGAALVHLDSGGVLITTSAASGPDLAALRRAQALAATGPAGIEIARSVIGTKIEGQRALLDELPGGSLARGDVDDAISTVEAAPDLAWMVLAEAQAASAYWTAWADLPIPFPAGDARKLPEHWLTFGQRASLLTGGPRVATNPANAILNYLYALLEAETILACHAVGLDPGVGIFHTDQRDRASLALDLMEAIRPHVDAYVLAMLTQRVLSAREFSETRRGACRFTTRFAASLTDTCTAWAAHIAPIVEGVAHTLGTHATSRLPRLTPLTRRNWKAAWDTRAPDRRQRQLKAGALALPATCRDCGSELPDRRQRYCENCRRERWIERASQGPPKASQVLAQLRAEQRDPAHGGRAAEMRGAKNAAHQAAVRDWTGSDRTGKTPDPEIFRTEILPGLRDLPLCQLVAATGLSEHYCSLIRLGKRVPHPRHWEPLRGSTETE